MASADSTIKLDGVLEATEVAALADTIAQLHAFTTLDAATLGTAPFAVVPEGKKLQSIRPFLDEFRALPDRRRGTAQLQDVESFITLTNRFKSAASVVFANPDRVRPSVTAILDYHPAGDDATKADWLKHRAVYAPPLSDEWKVWGAKNGVPMQQGDFAAFIEDRVRDLVVPKLDDPNNTLLKVFADLVDGVWASPSDMVRLSRGLQVNVESVVKNAQILNSGELSIVYEETHRDGAGEKLVVPTLFRIAIPVFYAGPLYGITARLRYRVAGGKITWSYQLVQPELSFDDAFAGIVDKVRQDTALPVLLGAPEQ